MAKQQAKKTNKKKTKKQSQSLVVKNGSSMVQAQGGYRVRMPKGGFGGRPTTDLRKLILDPCNAALVPGPIGAGPSGYITRLRTRITLHSISSRNNGYFVWFPDYHCFDASGTGSAFVWEYTDISTQPENAVGSPFGSANNPGSNTAYRIADPAYRFIGSSAESARTLAACAAVLYTGTTMNCAGEIGVNTNIDPSSLIYSTSGLPASVQNVLETSQSVMRMPATKVDVLHMPTDINSIWHTNGSNYVDNPNTAPDTPVSVAPNNASYLTDIGVNTGLAPGIAIAWNGLLNSTTNDLVIELTKVVEWRPRMSQNIVSGQFSNDRPISFSSVLSGLPDKAFQVMESVSSMGQLMGGGVVGAMSRMIMK